MVVGYKKLRQTLQWINFRQKDRPHVHILNKFLREFLDPFVTNTTNDISTIYQFIINTIFDFANSQQNQNWVHFLPVATGLSLFIISSIYSLTYTLFWKEKSSSNAHYHLTSAHQPSQTFYLTRLMLLRGMGIIYSAAFLTSCMQSRALFGTQGLNPSPGMIAASKGFEALLQYGRPIPAFIFLAYFGCIGDLALEGLSWIGVFLALLLILLPSSSRGIWAMLPLLLWLIYLSIVNLDGMIMNYGWEWGTLEVGFLMIFLCPLSPSLSWSRRDRNGGYAHQKSPFTSRNPNRHFPTSSLVLWLLRWSTFRLMLGAGMSKIGRNSSACWLDLSCTEAHYETQPMPNALGWLFHKLPRSIHQVEVAITFFEQLVLPWFVILPPVFGFGFPRYIRQFVCVCECFLQICIVGTGNYAWINYLGIVPCFAMLDDDFLRRSIFTFWMFSCQDIADADAISTEIESKNECPYSKQINCKNNNNDMFMNNNNNNHKNLRNLNVIGVLVRIGLLGFILIKSVAPLRELCGPAPWLHYYDDYFFVNAQGVFGFINQHRVVLVLETSFAPLDKIVAKSNPNSPTTSCVDQSGVIARDNLGNSFNCNQLQDYCSTQGVSDLCPVACGVCPINILPSVLIAPPYTHRPVVNTTTTTTTNPSFPSSVWTGTLEFKNLPGDVHRAPGWNSPYHYRFDWEVWIRTTASLEHKIDFDALNRVRALGKGLNREVQVQKLLPEIPIPPIVQRMIDGVLKGDTDSISLLANSQKELLQCGKNGKEHTYCETPTAIRARYYLYKYSSFDQLKESGAWWVREPISRPKIFLQNNHQDQHEVKRLKQFGKRSPWQRHWILLSALFGFLGTLFGTATESNEKILPIDPQTGLRLLLYFGLFLIALNADDNYDNDDNSNHDEDSTHMSTYSLILLIAQTGMALVCVSTGLNFTSKGGTSSIQRRAHIKGWRPFISDLFPFLSSLGFVFLAFFAHGARVEKENLLTSWRRFSI